MDVAVFLSIAPAPPACDPQKRSSDASRNASEGTRKRSEGTRRPSAFARKRSEGTRRPSAFARKRSEGTRNASDATLKASDGPRTRSDGARMTIHGVSWQTSCHRLVAPLFGKMMLVVRGSRGVDRTTLASKQAKVVALLVAARREGKVGPPAEVAPPANTT